MSDSPASSERKGHGLLLMRIASVPVYLSWTWALVAAFILLTFGPRLDRATDLGPWSYAVAATYALLLVASVLAHEGAHAVVARGLGMPVSRIVLDFWGGHTVFDSAHLSAARSALVSIAGPAANLALFGLGAALRTQIDTGVAGGLVNAFTVANLWVAIFNLLPGHPLDGGHVLEALVWRATGSRPRGLEVAGWAGRVVVVLGVSYVLVLPLLQGRDISTLTLAWVVLIGSFMWQGASSALNNARVERHLAALTVREVWHPVVPVSSDVSADRLVPRLRAAGPRGLGVVVDNGATIGIVDVETLASIPPHALAATPVTAVMQRLEHLPHLALAPGDSVRPAVMTMLDGHHLVGVTDPAGQLIALLRASDFGIGAGPAGPD